MAVSVSIDHLSALTDKYFVRKLVDNFFLSSPLLFKLKEAADELDGGSDIRVPVSYGNSPNAGAWSGRSGTLPTNFVNHATQAVFDWRYYYASITLFKTDVLQNQGRSQIVNLVKAQSELAEMSLKDSLGIDIYKDGTADSNGNNTIDGLSAMITYNANPTPRNYGGISRSSSTGSKASPTGNAFWNGVPAAANAGSITRWKGAITIDNSSTVLSLLKMQQLFSLGSHGNERPDLIISGFDLHNKYWSLLQANQRQAADEEIGKAGFKYLVFNDVPYVVDDNIDNANKIYMLNTNHISLKVHKDMFFSPTPFREPPNQLGMSKFITFMGNLTSDRPNLQVMGTGFTSS